MNCFSKYKWLVLIAFVSFICFWILFGKDAEFRETSYPFEVVDNEIRIKETGDVLYRFIPVDGGDMSFDYSDTMTVIDKKEVFINAYKKHINSFLIGETPVTKRLWYLVMNDIDINEKENSLYKYFTIYEDSVNEEGWKAFVEKLGKLTGREFRIPNSNEWEYAARGGLLGKKYKYSGSDSIDEVAYYKNNALPEIFSFLGMQKKPNELGLYDMSGGVWELTTTKFSDVNRLVTPHISQSSLFEMSISRGGNHDSPAEDCTVQSMGCKFKTGLRLILNY